jgi:hypothetical protein
MDADASFDLAAITPPRVVQPSVPAGQYTIELRMDATNTVPEADEANNILCLRDVEILPDYPNMIPEDVDFSPDRFEPEGGTMISFSGRITNTGPRPVTGDFWVEVFAWPDRPDGYLSPVLLCDSYRITEDLQAGESVALATLPPRASYALEPGAYRVAIAVDRPNEIAEQREDDNVGVVYPRRLNVGSGLSGAAVWNLYR